MPRTAASRRFSLHPAATSVSGSYIKFGDNFDFERTDARSFSFWLYADSLSSAQILISKANVAPGYWINLNLNGKISFDLVNTFTTNELWMRTTSIVGESHVWNHIVVTYDGSSTPGGVVIYKNGVSLALDTLVNNLTSTILNAVELNIGTYGNTTSQPMQGNMTDVRIHDAALTSAQVLDLYYDDIAVSVIAHWPYTDNSGTTLTATTGGVNGTLVSSAAWKTMAPPHFGARTVATARTAATARTLAT